MSAYSFIELLKSCYTGDLNTPGLRVRSEAGGSPSGGSEHPHYLAGLGVVAICKEDKDFVRDKPLGSPPQSYQALGADVTTYGLLAHVEIRSRLGHGKFFLYAHFCVLPGMRAADVVYHTTTRRLATALHGSVCRWRMTLSGPQFIASGRASSRASVTDVSHWNGSSPRDRY